MPVKTQIFDIDYIDEDDGRLHTMRFEYTPYTANLPVLKGNSLKIDGRLKTIFRILPASKKFLI